MRNLFFRNLLSLSSVVVIYSLGRRLFQISDRNLKNRSQDTSETLINKNDLDHRITIGNLYDKYKLMVYLDWLSINDVKDDFKVLKTNMNNYIHKGFKEFSLDIDTIYNSFDSHRKNDTNDKHKELINKFLSLELPSERNCLNYEYQNVSVINDVHSYIRMILTVFSK